MDAGDRDYNDLFLVNQHRFLAMPAEATNRAGARTDTEPSQPFDYTLPKDEIFAVALEGYEDENDECYRMKITVPKDRGPDWGKTDRLHQEPEKWNVSASIIDLTGTSLSVRHERSSSRSGRSQCHLKNKTMVHKRAKVPKGLLAWTTASPGSLALKEEGITLGAFFFFFLFRSIKKLK